MLRDYADIKSRLGEPLWWDEHGVPRYDPFKPDMCGVYDLWVALYEIACQACDRRLPVSQSWSKMEFSRGDVLFREDLTVDDIAAFHYGDPPRHDCPGAGETMNCWDLRVLEFWAKDRDMNNETWGSWVRVPEVEQTLPDWGYDA